MDPELWGPFAWFILHEITLSYPENPEENIKEIYRTFFLDFGRLIPCDICRNNFKNHLQQYPLNDDILGSRIELVKWLINIHNCVNILNDKKIVSYDEFIEENNSMKELMDREVYANNFDTQLMLLLEYIISNISDEIDIFKNLLKNLVYVAPDINRDRYIKILNDNDYNNIRDKNDCIVWLKQYEKLISNFH